MAAVLVIEDEQSLRENLVRILAAEGHDVRTARDGEEGIRLAAAHRPDLVICDVLMPQVDGYGVLAALRARAETRATPFIFVTASADKAESARALVSGADAYVTKPFRIGELKAAVARLLAAGRGRAGAAGDPA